MSIKLLLTLGLYLIWGFTSWQWYVCGVKQACPASWLPEDPPDTRPLVFNWGNPAPIPGPNFVYYRDSSLLPGIPRGHYLEITGLYAETEPEQPGFTDLGKMRALEVKKLLAEKFPAERLLVSSGRMEEPESARDAPFESLTFKVTDHPPAESVEITELNDRIVIHFPFKSAVKELEPEVDAAFAKLAERLQKTAGSLRITGHTDGAGNPAANLALGTARAAYIRDILLAKGIAASRLSVASKGEGEPVADNTTEAGQAQNRRVEIQLDKQ